MTIAATVERIIQRTLNSFVLIFPIVAAVRTDNLIYLLTIIPIGATIVIIDSATVKK